ncbi:hypothetical protein KKE03_03310 [Patescibacteria group bacterium]|nr:hypothetical protein [Patescibacteria group bacterium]
MLKLIGSKIDQANLKKISEDLDGYIKIVVDISREIMTAGGTRHVDGEQLLLKNDSKQNDLWGGGIDLETEEIDFDSMINIRPNQGNNSREVLSQEIRDKIKKIASKLLGINL